MAVDKKAIEAELEAQKADVVRATEATAKDKEEAFTASFKKQWIADYYKYTLMGCIAADTGSRLPEILTSKAMDYAEAAYNTWVGRFGPAG